MGTMTASKTFTVANTIGEAQLRACNRAPYFRTQIMSLIPVCVPGLPFAAAVDEGWRMYFNPNMIPNHPINVSAGIVMHELLHVLFVHFKRTRDLLGGREATQEERIRANIAGDLAINPIVREMGLGLPEGVMEPKNMGLQEGLTMEEYYYLVPQDMVDKCKQYEDACSGKGGEGEDGQGQGQPGFTQSPGCDGQKRDWQLPGNHETCPAKSELEQELLRRDAARQARNAGNSPGGLKRFIEDILDSVVPWQKELRATIAFAVSSSHGNGDRTFKRPCRRAPPEILLPRVFQPQPRVGVWIDTSGSMGQADLREAVSEAAAILKSLKCSCRIYAGDTEATAKTVYKHTEIELVGGGGTDGAGILTQIANDRPKSHVIVAITDGFTGWPHTQFTQKTIACITSAGTKEHIPSWIKVVQVGNADKKRGRR